MAVAADCRGMPKARRDPNTPPKRAILAISRLRRPWQLLILTGDQEASRAGAIAYSTLLNCATRLYSLNGTSPVPVPHEHLFTLLSLKPLWAVLVPHTPHARSLRP